MPDQFENRDPVFSADRINDAMVIGDELFQPVFTNRG